MEQEVLTTVGDDDLKREIVARYKACESYYGKWDEVAKDDYRFALGDQWDEADRQTLKEQCRPCLTFNRIKPLINIVSGYQRENSARLKVKPEGGEDKVFSDTVDRIIGQIDKWSHLTNKLGYLFDDGLYCGKGFIEAMLSYDKDAVRGELMFKLRTPYQIRVDPDCMEYDINEEAKYVFKTVRLTKEKLKYLFPDKKKLIDGFVKDNDDEFENGMGILMEGDKDDYGNNPNKTTITRLKSDVQEDPDLEQDMKFTLKEYWYKKRVKRYFVIDLESGEPRQFETTEEAESFMFEQGDAAMELKVIDRMVEEMHVATMVCGHILQDEKSPFEPYYSGFPFFRFIAEWAPNAETEIHRVQGITRAVNKSKSQNLHILNTQANSGWVCDDDALSPEGFKDLENVGSKPGLVVRKRPGKEIREIVPKGPNVGHIQREQQADEEFKQISAINPDLMGMQEGTASGKAIALRVRQAVMALVRIFSNYRYTKEILGLFILKMIPALFDSKKVMRIIGPQYMRNQANEQYPEGLNEGHLLGFLQLIADSKYDVVVTEADNNVTFRYETFSQLVELVKAGMPIPPDLIIDYMDLPNGEEIKQKILQLQQMQMQQQALAQVAKSVPAGAGGGGNGPV